VRCSFKQFTVFWQTGHSIKEGDKSEKKIPIWSYLASVSSPIKNAFDENTVESA
jgi:hypothetical protein